MSLTGPACYDTLCDTQVQTRTLVSRADGLQGHSSKEQWEAGERSGMFSVTACSSTDWQGQAATHEVLEAFTGRLRLSQLCTQTANVDWKLNVITLAIIGAACILFS